MTSRWTCAKSSALVAAMKRRASSRKQTLFRGAGVGVERSDRCGRAAVFHEEVFVQIALEHAAQFWKA